MTRADTADEPDRFAVVEALTEAATELGWRLDSVESSEWRVTLVVLPPLARSRPERNRWPNEPEEREEQLYHRTVPDGA